MATKVDIAGTNISASQMSEFFRLASLPSGSHVNRDTFQAYLERRNPFAFERNEHGHIVLTITGLDLAGVQEIERLKNAGYCINDYAGQILTSTKPDGYDAKHRLIVGQKYRIVLLPGNCIARDSDRKTRNLRAEAEKLGYGKPLAGIVPRIRETVSDKQMEEMGIWYIAALHETIPAVDGYPYVLYSYRYFDGRCLGGCWGDPDYRWIDDGAFAFVLPAS
jgi:hypothetical protein